MPPAVESSTSGQQLLVGVLSRLFPPFVSGVLASVGNESASCLHPEEQSEVRAVPPRRRQFLAGRACAHAALRAIDADDMPVGKGSAGEPLWPPGVVGSISHTGDLAAAVVARDEDAWGLGLDIEPLEPPLRPGVERLIRTRAELSQAGAPHDLADYTGKIAFCAKECVYKCLFPATRWLLDFQDVTVDVDLHASRYRAVVDDRFRFGGLPLRPLEGRFEVVEGYLLAGLCVPPMGPWAG